jgi:hypothetical protein
MSSMTATMTSDTDHEVEPDEGFDFAARVDELRCHPNEMLRRRIGEAKRAQQRWRLEELAALRVLDDRDALGKMPDRTESARTQRAKRETARALEERPALARAFRDGSLSTDQLEPACALSTPETDAEWAARAPNLPPAELQRQARKTRTPSVEDERERWEARALRKWHDSTTDTYHGRWSMPGLHGLLVDRVLDVIAERMRPAKGESWDSLSHRWADALHDLAANYADVERSTRPIIEVVEIHDPRQRPGATINGQPISVEQLSAIKVNATVRRCETDEAGCARTVQRPRKALPKDVERHVRRRDTTCRVPGCENRRGLQIHHTEPICDFGDSHLVHKLAGVCPPHHHVLEPHGLYRLVGDAERPDGLRLERVDAHDGPDP